MQQEQVIGILSDWDKIEAEIRTGLHEDFGKSKDIQDILDIIHELQVTANTVSPLRTLFMHHTNDKENPHEVTVSLGDLDLLTELYSLYTEKFGIKMNMSEFGYALVNVKRFATKLDVDNNTNLDNVVNLDVVNYLIEKHDTSPVAHEDLFRYRLPGNPIATPPAEVFEPSVIFNNSLIVERNCPINYYDINGRVKTTLENTLPIDYSFGKPAAPIFGPHRNILPNSKILTDVSYINSVRSGGSDLFILTPVDDTNFLLLQESEVYGSHGFSFPLPEELTGNRNYCIHSYPLDRACLNIQILKDNEILVTAVYDCDAKEVHFEGNSTNKIYADIDTLPNGWFRCWISFDAAGLSANKINVNIVKEPDQNNFFNTDYMGVSCNAMAFWQHQLTDTVLPVPPIFTDNAPVSVLGTKVRREFTNIFNPIRGSFVIRYLSPMSELFGVCSGILRIGDNTLNTSTVTAETNVISPKRNRIFSYNIQNDVLELIDSAPYDPSNPVFLKRLAFTYGLGYQGYGFTDQKPKIFATSVDSIVHQADTFFESIYTGDVSIGNTGVYILQVPEDVIDPNATDNNLVTGALANTAQYRLNMHGNILELGYDSITDRYLEGYLLNFKYYTVFASNMNLEFLLDQYIPE